MEFVMKKRTKINKILPVYVYRMFTSDVNIQTEMTGLFELPDDDSNASRNMQLYK